MWPRVAAAVFLVAVAAGIWWWAGNSDAGVAPEAAAVEEAPLLAPTEDLAATRAAADTTTVKITPPEVAARESRPAPSARKNDPVPAAPLAKPAPAIEDQPGIALAEESEAAPAAATRSLRIQAAPAVAPPIVEKDSRTISGRVTTPEGTPLSGVVVTAPTQDFRTLTDNEGQYRLAVDSNVRNLAFDAAGYRSTVVPVEASDSLNILLSPADAGQPPAAAKRKEAEETPQVASIAQPEGGFRKLEQYLSRNLRYPQAARQKGIEGTVRLQFTVRADDGIPSNFKVLQSLTEDCNNEAIRLLREGPKWNLPPGVNEITQTYEVPFKLPN